MYINTETLEYPVTEQQIRDAHPSTIFPVPFSPPERYMPVFQSPAPAHNDLTQAVREIAPVLTGKGHYEQTWEVYDLPAEAVAGNIAARKEAMIASINQRRDHLEAQGFPHAGLWFQSDERSVARINSTALTAASAIMSGAVVSFPDWLAEDNTPLQIDAQGVLALQASLTRHAGELHAHARALKELVNEATTAADLAAIDVNTGWPSR